MKAVNFESEKCGKVLRVVIDNVKKTRRKHDH